MCFTRDEPVLGITALLFLSNGKSIIVNHRYNAVTVTDY